MVEQHNHHILVLPEFANKILFQDATIATKAGRTKAQGETAIISQIGPDARIGLWNNRHNVVHVINTRFMQHQHNLEHLGQAQLNLFQTFTLPSIRQQTNHDFLWIIWTDARLEGKVLDEMLQAALSLPNAVLLGAEQEPDTAFRTMSSDGGSLLVGNKNLNEVFLAGSRQYLFDYLEASRNHLLVETNLDADDALSKNFVESVQRQAASTMGRSPILSEQAIQVYCPERHLEWRYYKKPSLDEDHWKGHFIQFYNPNFCISSGLTTAYHVQATARQMKGIVQCNIQSRVPQCADQSSSSSRRRSRMLSQKHQAQAPCGVTSEQHVQEHVTRLSARHRSLHPAHHHRHHQCPTGSFPCTNLEQKRLGLGGPSFMVPFEMRTCQVVFSEDTTRTTWKEKEEEEDEDEMLWVDVEVTPSRYAQGEIHQTGIDLHLLSEIYLLASVALKTVEGGNQYTWDTDRQTPRAQPPPSPKTTGGVKSGRFVTPDGHAIHHVEVCVIPIESVCGGGASKNAWSKQQQNQAPPNEAVHQTTTMTRTRNQARRAVVAQHIT
ncbi:hypothetical protein ACA910_004172 [Epithemia clementina (nom. ined.)]